MGQNAHVHDHGFHLVTHSLATLCVECYNIIIIMIIMIIIIMIINNNINNNINPKP